MKTKTIFIEALGDSPVIRVLDFLIEGRGLDYSLSDIARNANIGWTTLHRILDNLLKFNIVKQTREIGRAKLFQLNQENPSVKRLINLYDALLYQETEKHFKKEIKIPILLHNWLKEESSAPTHQTTPSNRELVRTAGSYYNKLIKNPHFPKPKKPKTKPL